MNPYTWKRAIDLFEEVPRIKANPNLLKNLKTALNDYVRPALEPNATSLTSREFATYCSTATIDTLKNALEIFDEQFNKVIESGQRSPNTKRTYHWPLNTFMKWIEQEVWYQELFPDPIDQPMPPYRGVTKNSGQRRRSTYALKEEQLSIGTEQELRLAQQMAQFKEFWTRKGREAKRQRRGAMSIRLSTHDKTKQHQILCFCGWYVNIKGHKLSELSLELLLDVDLVEEFIDWLIDERHCNHSAGINVVQAAISVAKFLNSAQSNTNSDHRRRSWSNIPVIEKLRDIGYDCQDEYRSEKKRNEEEKWLLKKISHREAREVVQYLKKYRSLCYSNRRGRHPSAVWWDWQRYLGVKFLTYSPVRQEEIRQLELGKTLFRKIDAQGQPYYEVKYLPEFHKLGSRTNKSRHYKLPSILTQDLDDWLNIWRPKIVDALQSLDNWLKFWGHPPLRMKRLEQDLEKAKQGQVCKNVKVSVEQYSENTETKIRALQKRIDSWETAKATFESHDRVFILLGSRKYPDAFGRSMDEENFWSMITHAVAFATQALYGEARWTNPHGFRHIGDKQVRKVRKGSQKDFDVFIGHSEKMGDEYAEQIMSEFEQTEYLVDDWWEENASR